MIWRPKQPLLWPIIMLTMLCLPVVWPYPNSTRRRRRNFRVSYTGVDFAIFIVNMQHVSPIDVIDDLYNKKSMIAKKYHTIIMDNADKLNAAIVHARDFRYNYFEFNSLRSFLLTINEDIVERPQHMFMRASLAIHGEDIDAVIDTYDMISKGYVMHSSPNMMATATVSSSLSSHSIYTGLQQFFHRYCSLPSSMKRPYAIRHQLR